MRTFFESDPITLEIEDIFPRIYPKSVPKSTVSMYVCKNAGNQSAFTPPDLYNDSIAFSVSPM